MLKYVRFMERSLRSPDMRRWPTWGAMALGAGWKVWKKMNGNQQNSVLSDLDFLKLKLKLNKLNSWIGLFALCAGISRENLQLLELALRLMAPGRTLVPKTVTAGRSRREDLDGGDSSLIAYEGNHNTNGDKVSYCEWECVEVMYLLKCLLNSVDR